MILMLMTIKQCEHCLKELKIKFKENEVFKIVRCLNCGKYNNSFASITEENEEELNHYLEELVYCYYCEDCGLNQ